MICGAGTLACSAETHLGASQSVENSRRHALVFHARIFPHLCRAFEERTARDRNCALAARRKRVDAEMSLGAAGKSACATKPRGPHSMFWKMYKLESRTRGSG